MVEVLIWSVIFLVSLFVLIKASDCFTSSAEKIGLYFGIPAFIVGVTIVAVGTSLPELVSSIVAVLTGASEIVVGNVVGSNIANVFLILGLTAIVGKKLITNYEIIHIDLPLLVGSAFLLGLVIYDGKLNLIEALLLIAGIVVYFLYTISIEKKKENERKVKKLQWKSWVILIASAIFIFLGAKYTVDSVIRLSEIFNIGKEIIAASAVAIGTSLPELSVSISAAKKGNSEMAIGNVLGSNIFNAFAVMGIPALIGTLVIPQNIITFALPVMITATLLFFFMAQEKEITKWEGYLLVIFYIFFLGKLFNLF